MTEEIKPRGSPYGLAMALLQQAILPGAVIVLPDHVLWPCNSSVLRPETFQLLEEAAAVLSALGARHIPLALLVPSSCAELVQDCLGQASLAAQFKAVVHFRQQQQQQVQAEAVQQQLPPPPQLGVQHAQQQGPAGPGAPQPSSSAWMEAANALKAQTGVPWQQMLFFSPAGACEVARLANKLGMAVVRVPAAAGLGVEALKEGLEMYGSKFESDCGF